MRKIKRARWLLLTAVATVFILAGCASGKLTETGQEKGDPEQTGPARLAPDDPEYCACILPPRFWGQGIILEGSPKAGYLLIGFNVPAGTSIYAPFAGIAGAVTLEDYSSDKTCAGCSLYPPGSVNGFSAYNVTGATDGSVATGDVFAEVRSEQYIFPKIYGKVNLILEFNFFDTEAAEYTEMQALFEKIFDHLLENREAKASANYHNRWRDRQAGHLTAGL